MRFQRKTTVPEPGLSAVVRIDRRTPALLARLQPGEIALLDHPDLDRATAQRLVDAEPAMVLNLSPFVSGRHPALGVGHLLNAGIPMIDALGAEALTAVRDGQSVRVHEGALLVGDEVVATGTLVDPETLAAQLSAAESNLAAQLITLTHNTAELVRTEEALVLHGIGVPRLDTELRDRDVLVVADGADLSAELRGLKPWLRQQEVTVVAVDRVADSLLELGIRVDVIIVGPTLASSGPRCSAKVLRAAGDVVLLDGVTVNEREALERMGLRLARFTTTLPAPDAALILASVGEARMVVAAGQHGDLNDLLDRRDGAAAALLARLRTGPQFVDARVLPHLWTGRVHPVHLWLVLLAGLLAVLAAVAVTPVGQDWLSGPTHDFVDFIRGLF